MKETYQKIAQQLELSEAAKARISAMLTADGLEPEKTRQLRFQQRKAQGRLLMLISIFLLCWSLFSVLRPFQQTEEVPAKYASAEQLSSAVAFAVADIPNLPFTATETKWLAYTDGTAEIIYEKQEVYAVYRKSRSTADNSGDHQIYEVVEQTEIRQLGLPAVLKGSVNGYSAAVWSKEDFSYSLQLSFEMSEAEWQSLLPLIN